MILRYIKKSTQYKSYKDTYWLLVQGGAVSPHLRPQIPEHQSENKQICQG